MTVRNIILEYFRLIRFSTAGNEIGVVLLGAFMMGLRDIFSLSILFIIGFLGHIFGYVLNEYIDVEVDKKLIYEIKKPLVSGVIPRKNALIISLIACVIAYGLTFYYFFNFLSISLLTLAVVLTIIYDVYGKKIPLSDFIIAGTLGVFIIFGASTVNVKLPNFVFLTGLIFFFDVVFMNFVEGGIKDIDHDFKAGAKTMATRMGVKVEKNRLAITTKFRIFAYVLRILFFVLIIILGLQSEINLWYSNIDIIYVIVLLLMAVVVISSIKLLHTTIFDKSKLYRLFTVLNSASVALLLMVLFPLLGLWVTIFLLLLPITWFIVFNYALYKKPLQPLV